LEVLVGYVQQTLHVVLVFTRDKGVDLPTAAVFRFSGQRSESNAGSVHPCLNMQQHRASD